ncbi:MAG: DUF4038 domain-containing protein [Verrucomicrobiota bacterium]
MPRIRSLWLVLLLGLAWGAARAGEWGVTPDGRFLTLKGKPFFWQGDTVWLLAQVPSRAELDLYLRTRAEQGFTVIQLSAIMGEERVWGTARATSRGNTPFIDGDVLRPAVTPGHDPANATEYDYWDHLDYVLERIHAHGLRAALVTFFVGWRGDGYRYLKPDTAYGYGRFLGERYRGKPELIWILGGDNTPDTDEKKQVWNGVAKGITEGICGREDYTQTLMTYHINGGSSSGQMWHRAPWLDFNMAQTWSEYANIDGALRRDAELVPRKPLGLGEGAYEDGPQYPTRPIDALVIRKQAAWSYFAGGYHTYGNGNVWHFDTFKDESTQPWKEALFSPGAASLRHLKDCLTAFDWRNFTPDPALFAEGQERGQDLRVALRHQDGKAILAYLPGRAPVKLHLEKLAGNGKGRAVWINPATGEKQAGGDVAKALGEFVPPPGWRDALLQVLAE